MAQRYLQLKRDCIGVIPVETPFWTNLDGWACDIVII